MSPLFDTSKVLDPGTAEFFLGLAIFAPLALAAYTYLTKPRSSLPLPPGPKGEWILGHLRVVPAAKPELAYIEWGKEYSQSALFVEGASQPSHALTVGPSSSRRSRL